MLKNSNRIAIIHPFMAFRGGAERKILLLVNHLISKGHDVTLYVLKLKSDQTFKNLLPSNDRIKILKIDIFTPLRLLIINRYDTLYVSNYPANLVSIFLRAKEKIWICNEVALFRSMENGWKVPKYKIIIDRLSVRQFDRCIVNSINTQKYFQNYYKSKSSVIYSGFNIDELLNLESKKIDIPTGFPFIFILSRISYDKNIYELKYILDYIKKKNKLINVIVAGEGPNKDFLLELAIQYDNLKYIGAVSEEEKKWLYMNCEVFAFLPKNEPLGVTIVEALIFGARIVSYNSGGPCEILKDFPSYLADTSLEYLDLLLDGEKYPHELTVHLAKKMFSVNSMLDGFCE